MSSSKRTRIIKLRVSESEHAALQARADSATLAAWMREFCLGAKPKSRTPVPAVDPALLRQVSGIGNNLNQIARNLNRGDLGPAHRLQVLAALGAIERELKQLRENHTG